MNATLHAFALIYRQSAAGKSGALKDYTLDWEAFLRRTDRDDGDARELAVQELLASERASGGLFVIDRHPRSRVEQVLRLKREGGETWLFEVTGLTRPTTERQMLAESLRQAAMTRVPDEHAAGWRAWLERLAGHALDGSSVMPLKRGDAQGNAALLDAVAGVLAWQGESLIRYASAVICRDSKALENSRGNVLAALREITGRCDVSLEDFGILDTPRSVTIHGPLELELPAGRIDFGMLAGSVSVSSTDLKAAVSLRCGARMCLTVENETVFRELAKRATGVLLVLTSFPGAATRMLFERLPTDLPCHHFGDSDPAGFDVLRDLREKTGRSFRPVMMKFRNREDGPRLTDEERRVVARLLETPVLADVHGELEAMLAAGTKGAFEQEEVPLDAVVGALALAGE